MSFPTFEFPPLFELLLQASWQAGLLVFIVLAMQRTLRCRLTPAWRHALWWVVLGRLLIPITPPSTWSLFNLIPTPTNERILSQGSLASSSGWQPVVARSPSGDSVESLKPAAPRAVDLELTPSTGAPGASPAVSIGSVMALAWAVVALFLLCRIGFQNLWFSRRVRSSMQPADPDLLTVLDECRSRMRIKRRIDLLQGDAVSSPAVFGILRPKVLLPRQLASTCQPDQLRHILLHELAHIRRGDPLVHGLTRVLQALHWFNPIHTWAFRRLRADREIATDALALEIAGEQESRAYGLTIVQLLQRWVAHPAQPNTVGILEDNTSLERRIRAIATYRRPSRWAPVASLLIVALAAASWTSAQTDGPPEAASLHPLVGTDSKEQLPQQGAMRQMQSSDMEAARRKLEAAPGFDPRDERPTDLPKLTEDGFRSSGEGGRSSLRELGLFGDEKPDEAASGIQADLVGRPNENSSFRQINLALLQSMRLPDVGFDRIPLKDETANPLPAAKLAQSERTNQMADQLTAVSAGDALSARDPGTGARGAGTGPDSSEPSYDGKTLSFWLQDLVEPRTWSLFGSGDTNPPSSVMAIRAIGSRAVPFLLARFGPDDALCVQACAAFGVLGRMGEAAIPGLLQLIEQHPGYATSALASIGAPAVPALRDCLNNEKVFGEQVIIPGNTMDGIANAISAYGLAAAEFLPLLPQVRELTKSTNLRSSESAKSLMKQFTEEGGIAERQASSGRRPKYCAEAQIAVMSREGYPHALLGSPEILANHYDPSILKVRVSGAKSATFKYADGSERSWTNSPILIRVWGGGNSVEDAVRKVNVAAENLATRFRNEAGKQADVVEVARSGYRVPWRWRFDSPDRNSQRTANLSR